MQVMALRIAEHVSKSHPVLVCTTRVPRPSYDRFQVLNNLRGRTEDDVSALNRVDVDIWLAMNAGYAAIARNLRKPLIVYFHGNDFLNPWIVSTPLPLKLLSKMPWVGQFGYGKRRDYARRRIGLGITSAVKILTNSSNTQALIREYYPQYRDVSLCPPGVEDKFFQRDDDAHRNSPVLKLLTVSRLQKATRRKNVAGVLHALALLRGHLNFTYSIVGDGDDFENLKRLSNDLGLADRVTFHGRVDDQELLRLYQCASLFVLPAKSSPVDVEGFGIVYLEANASGVPVLCSAAGGAVDAVVDGQTGIVLASSEPDQIAAGIVRFADSRAAYKAERLREFARNFTWEIAATRIESQILSAMDSLARARSEGSADPTRATEPSRHGQLISSRG
ncbi:MAG: glycosyltransferase [Candidatus Acidiferrum sp.]|jgi:glycosyltransferase involved in cell wall biosynthesis